MAVPKRHMSRSHNPPPSRAVEGERPDAGAVPVPRKETVVPHRACTHCGEYRGRQLTEPS